MDESLVARGDEDQLMERLIQVENALFFLKVRSTCGDSKDADCEVERLERLRQELHQSYARFFRHVPDQASSQSMTAAS
jgi:hypothetical protein